MTHIEVCGTRALLLLALMPAGFNARLGSSFKTDRESFAACYAICKDSTYALWDKYPVSPRVILPISTLLCVWGRCQRVKKFAVNSYREFFHWASHQLAAVPVLVSVPCTANCQGCLLWLCSVHRQMSLEAQGRVVAGCFRTCSQAEYLGCCCILLASVSRSSPVSVHLSWAVGANPFPGDAAGSSCRSPWYVSSVSRKDVVALFSTYLAGVCPLHLFLPLSKRPPDLCLNPFPAAAARAHCIQELLYLCRPCTVTYLGARSLSSHKELPSLSWLQAFSLPWIILHPSPVFCLPKF